MIGTLIRKEKSAASSRLAPQRTAAESVRSRSSIAPGYDRDRLRKPHNERAALVDGAVQRRTARLSFGERQQYCGQRERHPQKLSAEKCFIHQIAQENPDERRGHGGDQKP